MNSICFLVLTIRVWFLTYTVKDPEGVRFWHENAQLSANHSLLAFLLRRAVLGHFHAKIVHVHEL